MSLQAEKTRLRAEYGEGAIEAYGEISRMLMKAKSSTDVVVGLHDIFERYGLEATGAAFRLHAERMHTLVNLVHTRRPSRLATQAS